MSNPNEINKQFEQITKHLEIMNIEVFELNETDPLIDELQERFAQEMLNEGVMIPFTFIAELPDIVFENNQYIKRTALWNRRQHHLN